MATSSGGGPWRPPDFDAPGSGSRHAGAHSYNERLTLSLIRRHGPLPKAELARLTGLSAQTLSTIVRRLDREGLLQAQTPLRGRIGQPSVPYALNPLGALSFGVKIGRRSTDVMLCDFMSVVRERSKMTYAYPEPKAVLAHLRRQIHSIRRRATYRNRIVGIGIAMPFELWKWADEVDAPAGLLEGWRDLNIEDEITQISGLPTFVANDATAACGAELAHSESQARSDYLYIFVGSFVGGGVVLNGALFTGGTGNAGAIGSMPVHVAGHTSQLIQHASLITLEKAMLRSGLDVGILQDPDADWSELGALLTDWIEVSATALAHAIAAGVSIIDFPRIVIDGAMPPVARAALVARTRHHLSRMDLQGLSAFEVVAGTIGADARALGAATLPILAGYSCDTDVLFNDLNAEKT